MKTLTTALAAGFGAVALLTGAPALAHAKLTAAEPAAEATVAAPAQVVLHFSEKLEPKFSGFDLVKGGEKLGLKAAVGKDGKSLVGIPTAPVAAGAYQVNWHAVSADGHRMQGAYGFTVN
jgi:hypothetical protein